MVAVCGCLILDSIKRSVINIRRSTFASVRRLIQAIDPDSLIIKKPCHFGVISYNVAELSLPRPDTSRRSVQQIAGYRLIVA